MRPLVVLTLAALLLARCAAPAADLDPQEAPALPEGRPAVVIAVIDTGINLYHEECRRGPAVAALPARLADVERTPLALSLNLSDWEKAVEADREALDKVEPRTLYTVPGTKILGAISFNEPGGQWPLLLDRPNGHGTMTTSRAVGNTVSIPGGDPDVHLVLIQGFTP